MNREHGYTLIETLVTMVVVVILGASGLYGWQSRQRQGGPGGPGGNPPVRSATTWCCYAMTPTGTTAIEC